jgi:hypothetical protein
MKGLALSTILDYATKAGLAATADADGKFATVATSNRNITVNAPYLAVDGGVYSQVSITLGMLEGGANVAATRAELEADQATVASNNAAHDPALARLLAKVDRTKAFFFAGTGDGTPIADKVGTMYGSFDIKSGLTFDVTADLREDGAASRVMAQWGDMQSKLGMLPAKFAVVKQIVAATRLNKTGNSLRITSKISNAQLQELVDAVGPMLPRGGM